MRALRLAIILSLGTSAAVLAAKEFRVGYVDYDQVIAKYEGAAEAKKDMDTVRTGFEAKAESLKSEYEKAQAEYASQQLTLSEEGKRAKNAEVDQRKSRYDSYVAQVYGQGGLIDQRYKELIAPIVQKIDSSVGKLAVDEGFSLILDASKAGIVYSDVGLDLTQVVVDDLNREFAPVGPTVVNKKVYALMPVFNSNDLAAQDHVGAEIRDSAYAIVNAQPNVDVVPNPSVDQQLQSYGLQNRQVPLDKALDAGRALNADYVIYGSASKQNQKVSFQLSIADVKTSKMVQSQQGEITPSEDMKTQVSAVIRVLLAAVANP